MKIINDQWSRTSKKLQKHFHSIWVSFIVKISHYVLTPFTDDSQPFVLARAGNHVDAHNLGECHSCHHTSIVSYLMCSNRYLRGKRLFQDMAIGQCSNKEKLILFYAVFSLLLFCWDGKRFPCNILGDEKYSILIYIREAS